MKRKVFYILLLSFLVTGCIIKPRQVSSDVIAFDGSSQNAGFIGYTNGFGIITENKRIQYNALIEKYNSKLLVPLQKDEGLTIGPILDGKQTYLIDKEHLMFFIELYKYYLNQE